MEIRRVASVAEITTPPMKGDESERKYRGVLFENGELEYFLGDEYFTWEPVDFVPAPIKMSLEYILAWRALEEPDLETFSNG